ncbi:SOS response-associated peptidase [Devosia sp.]|uniref:SOS response-associated peptidase n=1 Tax=Devosia sp. TaxID=1871048 RepID=UPI003A943E48
MCGRYAATLPPEQLAELFQLLNTIAFPPRYNIAPTQPIAVIWEQQARRTIQLVRWGFVPSWVKDPREFTLLINARAETMAEKPSFRNAVRNGRCIVPASGYYEWKTGPDGSKQPYYITMADGSPMMFAGLYSQWAGPDGEEVDTACIVTVEPNTEVRAIYNRMPAILTGEAIEAWLNTRDVEREAAAQLALPLPDGSVKYHPVSKAVGSVHADGPELIRPIPLDEAEVRPSKVKKAASGGGQLDLF